jgi:signal transduction histidine kinase
MRRPWQVWLLYTLCVLAVAPALLWVTFKALELDRAEFAARRQAEQEEEVSRALWRIDARVTPLLAEEAARPDFVYQSLGSIDVAQLETSNYLVTPASYVLLHFELRSEGNGISPQIARTGPTGKAATELPATSDDSAFRQRLDALLAGVSFDELLAELPQQSLPQLTLASSDFSQLETPVVATNSAVLSESAYGEPNPRQQSAGPGPYDQPLPQQQAANPSAAQQANTPEAPLGNQLANAYGNSRAGRDLRERDNAFQAYTQRAIVQERGRSQRAEPASRTPVTIREGISRPVWVGDRLLFARRVERGDELVIQGCWLDWQRLKEELLGEVADLVPSADLAAVKPGDELRLGRILATLPVQLVVPPPALNPPTWSPIRLALVAVWSCLALAAGGSAWLLQGVVTLSERRASFVSAVTHELRTPLTTFRMYAEMLADGMVRDPVQQQKYLDTLRVEADRLTHLVDNVLLYARLERGGPGKNRVSISVGDMLDRFLDRLAERAAQANMKLELHADDAARSAMLNTDPAAVEQILFNLVDNACKYAALASNQVIILTAASDGDRVSLSVRDFGPGLSPSARKRLFQPFSKSSEEAAVSAPGVGLGLALCKRLAGDLGGQLQFVPAAPGAEFRLVLPTS